MVKRGLQIVGIVVILLATVRPVEAKRVLPRWSKTTKITTTSGGRPTVSVKFIPSRLGVNLTVNNAGAASSVSYSLTYFSREIEQGADGAVKLDGNTAIKQLIFGSCSTNNNCRYDSDVTDAKLTVTTVLKSGKRLIKSFKLKV